MGLQQLRNGGSLLIDPRIGAPVPAGTGSPVGATVINAAGESQAGIGYLILEGGAVNGAKTISAAGGGKIHWAVTTSAFTDAGTTVRVGLQDVDATGLEDGNFDVYADVVGGGSDIQAAGPEVVTTVMSNGSKTLNHGDKIAFVVDLQSVGASDSLTLATAPNLRLIPYRTQDTGAGPGKTTTSGAPLFVIQFDDGTLGWFITGYPIAQSLVSIGADTTPDEAGLLFSLPVSCEANMLHIPLSGTASTDTFNVVIYKDPLGTNTVLQTITVDPNHLGSATFGGTISLPISPLKISANRQYGVVIKPTSSNTFNFTYYSLGVGNSFLRKATILGENWGYLYRTDAGVFTYDEEALPCIAFEISKINDGRFAHTY